MNDYPRIRITFVDQIVDEIISELPLSEKIAIANMNTEDVELLHHVFNIYGKIKLGDQEAEDSEIIKELWDRLRKTHKMRIVNKE